VYYSHTLNAYEEGDSLVVDMTNFDAPFLVAGNGSGGPYGAGTPRLHTSGLTESEEDKHGLRVSLTARARTETGAQAETSREIVLSTADL
jgi:hypothetical protein